MTIFTNETRPMRVFALLFAAILGAGLLGGCARQAPKQGEVGAGLTVSTLRAAADQERRRNITEWHAHGRIGVIRGEQGWHAEIDWHQQGDAYEIAISGPVGQGAARLIGNAEGITLMRPDEAPVTAADPETLMREQLGWTLPLSGMRWWILGAQAPGDAEEIAFDAEGRIDRLRQRGWRLSGVAYQDVAGLSLPRKLRLEHPELTVKLVLDRWEFTPPPPLAESAAGGAPAGGAGR